MSRFWSPVVSQLTPYVPGEQPKIDKLIKLNTNENPYGPAPKAIAAMQASVGDALRLYPNTESHLVQDAVARFYGIAPEAVFVGNGSDEVLALAFAGLLKHDRPRLFPDITYSFYPVYCGLYGIDSIPVPLDENYAIRVDDYAKENGGIIIANPNAPTGLLSPLQNIEALLQQHPDQPVVIDEAYIDFGGESAVPLIAKYPNLLVVQTFSKSRQLAGARLGLAMGNAALIADLNRVKFSLNPYNINRLTLKAGQAALEDTAYFDRTRAAIVDTRAWTKQQLEQRGFAVLDSRSNFLFASTDRKDGGTLYKELKKNGILVRHFDAPRIQNWLRITIGTPEQMQTFMETLDKIMEE